MHLLPNNLWQVRGSTNVVVAILGIKLYKFDRWQSLRSHPFSSVKQLEKYYLLWNSNANEAYFCMITVIW